MLVAQMPVKCFLPLNEDRAHPPSSAGGGDGQEDKGASRRDSRFPHELLLPPGLDPSTSEKEQRPVAS